MSEAVTQHIGIVGCSAEGAALCYRTICAEGEALLGEHNHPEVSMHTLPLAAYMRYLESDDWSGVAELMRTSAEKLASIGADFAICPDNTIHQAFADVVAESPIPWLHIAEAVAEEANAKGYRRLGITGTQFLMSGPVYPEALARFEIESVTPSADAQREINRTIFEELVKGRFSGDAQRYFVGAYAELKEAGCDAAVMGCTEIPLLMDGVDAPLPLLDSTRLLARAALRRATEPAA